MVISLGSRLLGPSSDRPGSRSRAGPARWRGGNVCSRVPMLPVYLAPSGVCLAKPVTRPAGELLPHRFTLTRAALEARVAVCFLLHFP